MKKSLIKRISTALVCMLCMGALLVSTGAQALTPFAAVMAAGVSYDRYVRSARSLKKGVVKRTKLPSLPVKVKEEKPQTSVPVPVLPKVTPAPKKEEPSNGFVFCSEIPLSRELQAYTYSLCKELDVEYELVLALMWQESKFDPSAVGYNKNGTQDTGIMQINDINRGWLAADYGIKDLTDPYENIKAGASILSTFVHKHGAHNALMAYQFGEGGMKTQLAKGVETTPTIQRLYSKRDEFKALVSQCANI
ncbi:lytic transglycosylase domain-containing protein [Oscillospiraceae bacterium MB08-C2-2]|nr:lytic transglycosylase domain-containing protein [Oscillospiraceae bacterium MB08-C2-2]